MFYYIMEIIFYSALCIMCIVGVYLAYTIISNTRINDDDVQDHRFYTFNDHLSETVNDHWNETLKNKCKLLLDGNDYQSIECFEISHYIDMLCYIPFKKNDYYHNISSSIVKIINDGDSNDVAILHYQLKNLITTLSAQDFKL